MPKSTSFYLSFKVCKLSFKVLKKAGHSGNGMLDITSQGR